MSKNDPTLRQGAHLLALAEQSGVSSDHLQAIINKGFISDLFTANIEDVDRNEYRRALGHKPLPVILGGFKENQYMKPTALISMASRDRHFCLGVFIKMVAEETLFFNPGPWVEFARGIQKLQPGDFGNGSFTKTFVAIECKRQISLDVLLHRFFSRSPRRLTLAELVKLMERQSQGEQGFLSQGCRSNLVLVGDYIFDVDWIPAYERWRIEVLAEIGRGFGLDEGDRLIVPSRG